MESKRDAGTVCAAGLRRTIPLAIALGVLAAEGATHAQTSMARPIHVTREPVISSRIAPAPRGTPSSTSVGTPLPPGWSWPVNPALGARGLAASTVYRPVNVAALKTAAASATNRKCAPVEVAPSVWVTPLCTRLRPLSTSPRATPRPSRPRLTAAPASVDLRALGLDGPVKDQQAAGVCWSFAISSIMDNAARRAGRADVFAPLHIISNDEWNLLWTQGAGHTIVAEGSWPYDPHKACELDRYTANEQYCSSAYNVTPGSWNSDPPLVAQRAQAESLGAFKIIAFHPLKKQPASIDEIVDVLAGGQAIFADVDINIGAWSYSRGFDATGLIPDWEGDGGHAVEIAGYRTVSGQRQFLVHNSWGVSWGDGGYAWISEKMMRERLQEGFVVSVGDASGRPLQGAVTPTTLGVEDDGKTVPLKKGQDLILSLTSNPSTGLDWVLKSDGGLGPPKSEFVPANDDPDTVGGRGRRTFTWAATAPTDARSPRVIELEYKRAGDATTPPVKTFKATITFAD